MRSRILLSLYIYVFNSTLFHSEQHYFIIEQTVFNFLQTFQNDWVDSSTQSSLLIHNYCYIEYPVFCKYPRYVIVYLDFELALPCSLPVPGNDLGEMRYFPPYINPTTTNKRLVPDENAFDYYFYLYQNYIWCNYVPSTYLCRKY